MEGMKRRRQRLVCRILDLAVYPKLHVMLELERTADERSFVSIHRAGRPVCRLLPPSGPETYSSLSVGSLAFVVAVCFLSAWRVAALIILQVIGALNQLAARPLEVMREAGWRGSYSVCRGVCDRTQPRECHRGSSLGGSREDESSLLSQPSSAAIQNRYTFP